MFAGNSSRARVLCLLAVALGLILLAIPSRLNLLPPTSLKVCHATSQAALSPEQALGATYACEGKPEQYADRWIWLRHELSADQQGWEDWSLTIRNTRFETLKVYFHFADGTSISHQVQEGEFRSYWRPNGYLAFNTTRHTAPLVAITLGMDQLAAYEVVRLRLSTISQMGLTVSLTVLIAGAAFSLLGASFIYTLLLAFLNGHRIMLWHAGWLGSMILWGLVWTQLILLVAPGLAGSPIVRLNALLSATALTMASLYMLASLERGLLPRWLIRAFYAIAATSLGLSLLWSFAPSGTATQVASLFTLSTLGVLGMVVCSLVIGVIKNSEAAKDFALAWLLPVIAVATSYNNVFAYRTGILSEQLLVLVSGAMQALWLSYVATRSFAHLRTERDQARARQNELMILAETDPLTKLYNRRGFTERFRKELAAAEASGSPLGLMLIDIDYFKSINDTYGHDVGDHVLQRIATLLDSLRVERGIVARLGGEEFCVLLPGRGGDELAAVAERTRRRLAEADMSMIFGTPERKITASIGIADTLRFPRSTTGALLRLADQALYHAKAAGRNQVVAASEATSAASVTRRREAAQSENA